MTKNEETGIWYVDNDKSADAENVLSEYVSASRSFEIKLIISRV